jgi:hypothetical protein
MNLFRLKNSSSTNHKFNQRALFLIPLVLGCFAFSPTARAQISPAPDGGDANQNTAEGDFALAVLSGGFENTAIGFGALDGNTTGSDNTATGVGALFNNTTADFNTAMGSAALFSNTTGEGNVAVGTDALNSNTTGGLSSGTPNVPGEVGPNTAVGELALSFNVDAGANTAVGFEALASSVSGFVGPGSTLKGGFSTAVGFEALAMATGTDATHGTLNDAFGYQALVNDTDGFGNAGFGTGTLHELTTGHGNTALGGGAGATLTTGSGNVFIGALQEGTTVGESNHTYIRNIKNTAQAAAAGTVDFVTVNLTSGLLGHGVSSRRYKEDIKPMDNASEALLALRPVTFRYKKEIDKSQTLAFGLIAEEVAKVNPNLAIRNGKGEIEDVSYQQINMMLLNEFLKEHKAFVEAQHKVEKLETTVATLVVTVKEQSSQIQKVSAQLELRKPSPQTVLNNQ